MCHQILANVCEYGLLLSRHCALIWSGPKIVDFWVRADVLGTGVSVAEALTVYQGCSAPVGIHLEDLGSVAAHSHVDRSLVGRCPACEGSYHVAAGYRLVVQDSYLDHFQSAAGLEVEGDLCLAAVGSQLVAHYHGN